MSSIVTCMGNASGTLEAREVYQVLKDTAMGQRLAYLAAQQVGGETLGGQAVQIDDWWIVLASDEHGVAYCPACRAADGRTGSLDDWHRSGTDPVAFLSVWERQRIDALLAALERQNS